MNKRKIYVYADRQETGATVLIGFLYSERLRGKEVFSFEYTGEWLKSDNAFLFDPDLQLYSGLHYLRDEKKVNFGIFLDSSPDRWGRLLMRRREAALARIEKRPENTLFETDYLLGVHDGHRMGALRFKIDNNGPFLNNNNIFASPPWSSLKELEQISLKLEEHDVVDDHEYFKWLSMLMAPGSSLGGTRPKASIVDQNSNLWLAKFPSLSDNTNAGGWEMVTYELAVGAGIKMAESRVQKFSSDHYTFLTKRFDRAGKNRRIHFASAMTMLGYKDGEDFSHGASYLEILEFISNNGANVNEDLEELWRRIVFNICVSNTDDHLRNHGFILTEKGWVLSPAFDINPEETGTGLKLNINENDNSLSLDLAMDVCEYFRLTKEMAEKIIKKVKRSVQDWRTIASKYGISKAEQDIKAIAFNN
ncbi:MAG: HipA domain-containing protein [Bacteroidales bacterium]